VDERRVLLAHEYSQRRYRDRAYTRLADLAVTTNPLLRRPAAGSVSASHRTA